MPGTGGIPICVFAKPPVPGRVKTRLAASIGAGLAAEFAEAMLCDVWETLRSVEGVRPVLAAAEEGHFPELLTGSEIWMQGEGDLGQRMERIFQRGLKTATATLVVGSDAPQLRVTHICDALAQLNRQDAAIGPCPDGGYYLLGLKRCPAGLLAGLPWSTSDARCETEERLRANGFSIGTIDCVADLDVAEDLAALVAELGGEGAIRTRHCIAQHAAELKGVGRG